MPPKGTIQKRRPPKPAGAAAAATASAAAAAKEEKEVKMPENRQLGVKEAAIFKLVLQHYEQKQWKKGIKEADKLLAKHPQHGETLAMKGLFLACIDQKEEGYAMSVQGSQNDPTSHIVWHVMGLMYRADKEYTKALEAYVKASEIERDSLNILQDLSLIAAHVRNYPLFLSSRKSILRVGPRLRRNWLFYALAQYLAGELEEADKTLGTYLDMLREIPSEVEYESGDVRLWRAQIWDELAEKEQDPEKKKEQWESAVERMGEWTAKGDVPDRTAFAELRASMLLKLGRYESALWAWDMLLSQNADNHLYIDSYMLARAGLESSEAGKEVGTEDKVKVLRALDEKLEGNRTVKRKLLDLLEEEDFAKAAGDYLTTGLTKGIPSLFSDLKGIYTNAGKRDAILSIAEGFLSSLDSKGQLAGASYLAGEEEGPSVELWTLYFLAQHHSSQAAHQKALTLLDRAVSHTPTLPELYHLRARILKRMGDPQAAFEAMEIARGLDGQDRFLNCKSVKYATRAGRIERAEELAGLFTKNDAPSPAEDLKEMQALWFVSEQGKAYTVLGEWGKALKRWWTILGIFADYDEDQFDFHSYCVRKGTVRSYLKTAAYFNRLRSHPKYQEAAKGAIEIYLKMHDDPAAFVKPEVNGSTTDAEAEKSAAAAKAKKAAEAAKAASKKVVAAKKGGAKKDDDDEEEEAKVVPDPDPLGEKLAQTKEPLEEALKFLRPLEKDAYNSVQTWVLSYHVHVRRGKYLEAVKALRAGHALDSSSSLLHPALVHFALRLPTIEAAPEVLAAVKEAFALVFPFESIDRANAEKLQKASSIGEPSDAGERVLAVANALAVAIAFAKKNGTEDEAKKTELGELAKQILRPENAPRLKTAQTALVTLREALGASSPAVEEFRSAAADVFPLAYAFKTASELEQLTVSSTPQANGDH